MKRLLPLLVLALLACTAPARAVDKSLITEDDTWNLYTKLAPSLTELGSDTAIWGSVEVGGILNGTLAIGLRGTTLLDDVSPGFDGYESVDQFDATLIGLNVEYTLFSEALVHGSVGLMVGGGSITLGGNSNTDVDLIVVEPAVNFMLNVTQTSELGLGLGYRYMDPDGGSSSGLDEGDFSGVSLTLFLRLTEF